MENKRRRKKEDKEEKEVNKMFKRVIFGEIWDMSDDEYSETRRKLKKYGIDIFRF